MFWAADAESALFERALPKTASETQKATRKLLETPRALNSFKTALEFPPVEFLAVEAARLADAALAREAQLFEAAFASKALESAFGAPRVARARSKALSRVSAAIQRAFRSFISFFTASLHFG